MQTIIRTIGRDELSRAEFTFHGEWLLTNGLGGYASGTLSGSVTRRYHGLLIAALPTPFGRTVMLNHLAEFIVTPESRRLQFGGYEQHDSEVRSIEAHYLNEFRLENGLPVWVYQIGDIVLEKRIILVHHHNTAHITYRLVSAPGPISLQLRPSCHFRQHEQAVSERLEKPYELKVIGPSYEVNPGDGRPPLRLALAGSEGTLTLDRGTTREISYSHEADRGYDSRGLVWSPGWFTIDLRSQQEVTLMASTEAWDTMRALEPREAYQSEVVRRQNLLRTAHPQAQRGMGGELVLAADQFVITPAGRQQDSARAQAEGDEARTVIAGYHWFTDWGRDTMISLEGLTLTTGRPAEAGWILRTFAHYVKDGLIPNLFPEGQNEGLYHTADATLWFFHALDRYVEATQDRATLTLILPKLQQIVERHLHGTRFGIGVDPVDGLLRQGQEGYQLTWMDAKVEDWVVTPRRGKAVEINALWYNALCLLEQWLRETKDDKSADEVRQHASRTRESFNRRFWYESGGFLYDVLDGEQGNDASCRPNQIFSFSLRHAVLDEKYWEPVLRTVRQRLLTPVGLRSLAPGEPDYKARYFGNLRARDAAYHQGTVWGWLIGPFIDAWLRVYPKDTAGARQLLDGFAAHLNVACVGSLSEVFDAEAPYTARACIAQAWSVAEVLRCWVKTSDEPR